MIQDNTAKNIQSIDVDGHKDGKNNANTNVTNHQDLPYNIDFENILLGALLKRNDHYHGFSDFLKPYHFHAPLNQVLYERMVKIIEKGQTANVHTVHAFCQDDSTYKNSEQQELLISMVDAIRFYDKDISYYADQIYDLYLRRELMGIGETILIETPKINVDETAIDHIEEVEQKLFRLAEQGQSDQKIATFDQVLKETTNIIEQAINTAGSLVGATTGLVDLDRNLGGLHPSDLIILAARPSMGKTALATKFAQEAAKARARSGAGGAAVGFFSMEMSKEQLAGRLLSEYVKMPSHKLRRGEINKDDFHLVMNAARELSEFPIYIDDTPGLTLAGLRTRARRMKRQFDIGLLVVDYLQLIQPGERVNASNRVQVVSEITRGLKILAKELDVPIVALSQLSRGPELRDDKRPQLADLRDSGSIEQDADVVLFIYREEYYLQRNQPTVEGSEEAMKWQSRMQEVHNLAEVIIAKQRHGPLANVKVYFDAQFTAFGNLEKQEHGQGQGAAQPQT